MLTLTEFFDYVYCDTDPWNKTNKFDGAKFTGQSNPIGHKGYFKFFVRISSLTSKFA